MSRDSPFHRLGLDGGADVTQIKRAYARLLRTHRPDDDPVAFQRLHDAYEACLEQARWREMGLEDDDWDSPAVEDVTREAPAITDPAPDPAHPRDGDDMPDLEPGRVETGAPFFEDPFDAPAFIEDLVGRMHTNTRESVHAWLRAHEDHYSLDRKRGLAHDVVDALAGIEPEDAARHFEHVTHFFGLDTVAGIEPWLQQRLDGIRLRLDDAASFERILRSRAGANADWADQRVAKELLEPFHLLRRAFLISFPGMPGQVGEFARALHAADPVSAAAELNEHAMRFWQRATDRAHLYLERLGFMALRLGVWSIVIAGFIALIEDDGKGLQRGFGVDWAAALGVSFGLWLAYAVAIVALIRFRDYNQARMQWDLSLLISGAGLACGVVAVAMGSSGIFVWIMTTIYWLRARHDGQQDGYTSAQGAAFLAGVSGFAVFYLLTRTFGPASTPVAYQACAAAVFAFASQLAHDIIYAKVRRISLRSARHATGWLWPMFGIQAALFFLISVLWA